MFPSFCLQHQKRQQKLEGRVTLDNITSPSRTEDEQTDSASVADDGENEDNEAGEGNPEQVTAAEQDLDIIQTEKHEDEDSVIDYESSDTSSVKNRFTVLSEDQPAKDKVLDDDNTSDMEQEREETNQLVSEMEKVTLDDAFIEDSYKDTMVQGMDTEDEPLEAKEYTVVNQDPELAFCTLATRIPPGKQECSVQSCLFQFTDVEMLTQNNSLLCVACTKQQQYKNKAGGMWTFFPCIIFISNYLILSSFQIAQTEQFCPVHCYNFSNKQAQLHCVSSLCSFFVSSSSSSSS